MTTDKSRMCIAFSPFIGYFMLKDNVGGVLLSIAWLLIIYPWREGGEK